MGKQHRSRSREKHRRSEQHPNKFKERERYERQRTHKPTRGKWEHDKNTKQNQNVSFQKQPIEINRSQTCPFLVRVFYAINTSNEYNKNFKPPEDRELRLYLWMNSTLKQIAELIRAHLPAVRTKQRFIFSRISVQREEGRQIYSQKEIGTVIVHKKSQKEENGTLDSFKFKIGDYLDVSILYK